MVCVQHHLYRKTSTPFKCSSRATSDSASMPARRKATRTAQRARLQPKWGCVNQPLKADIQFALSTLARFSVCPILLDMEFESRPLGRILQCWPSLQGSTEDSFIEHSFVLRLYWPNMSNTNRSSTNRNERKESSLVYLQTI